MCPREKEKQRPCRSKERQEEKEEPEKKTVRAGLETYNQNLDKVYKLCERYVDPVMLNLRQHDVGSQESGFASPYLCVRSVT
jgi:hypothetical protein